MQDSNDLDTSGLFPIINNVVVEFVYGKKTDSFQPGTSGMVRRAHAWRIGKELKRAFSGLIDMIGSCFIIASDMEPYVD